MKQSFASIFLVIFSFLSLNIYAHAPLRDKAIYGKDNRVEIDDYPDKSFIEKAKSIAIRIPSRDLTPIGSDHFSFPTIAIQDIRRLCDDIVFNDQPQPGDCTGFLVGPKTLVTAGHCARNKDECSRNKWVFGFKVGADLFESSQVYSCEKIISQKYVTVDYQHADYAVIELDREVEGTTPLSFRKEGSISKDTPLLVIGHPSGLPMKASDGAVVKTSGLPALNSKLEKRPNFFAANLDTFGGNSGSPVFNLLTGLVEGILVKGRDDYYLDKHFNCYRLFKTTDDNNEDYELIMRINKVEGLH